MARTIYWDQGSFDATLHTPPLPASFSSPPTCTAAPSPLQHSAPSPKIFEATKLQLDGICEVVVCDLLNVNRLGKMCFRGVVITKQVRGVVQLAEGCYRCGNIGQDGGAYCILPFHFVSLTTEARVSELSSSG